MAENVDREKLYGEVWATPLTTLCKSYGMTYAGMRRLCSELDVPVPQRGHWARVAAGQAFVKPELPARDIVKQDLPAQPRVRPDRKVRPSNLPSKRHRRSRLRNPCTVRLSRCNTCISKRRSGLSPEKKSSIGSRPIQGSGTRTRSL
jgi:hypothetical protein